MLSHRNARVWGALGCALGLLGAVPNAGAQAVDAVAPDIRPEVLKDLRNGYGFKILDDPKMVAAGDAAFMKDEDYVLAVTVGGESRAYPTRFMGWHHGVNDRIGETPVAVTYCSVCRTGIAYDLRVNGKPILLDFYGLYNGVVTLCDRASGSVLIQAEGRFVKGPLLGTRLKHLPLLDTTWGRWKKLHPDTQVMSPDTPYSAYYRPAGAPETRGRERLSPFFISTITHGDLRLKPFEMVLGVMLKPTGETPEQVAPRAYPVKAVLEAGGVVNDMADGAPVAVFVEPTDQTAVAVSRTLEGRTLTFEARKDAQGTFAIYDHETGSRWTLEGKADEGPLAGKSLKPLAGNLSLWYGWSAYFPATSIFGRTDPPKPGNAFEAQPEAGAAKKAQ